MFSDLENELLREQMIEDGKAEIKKYSRLENRKKIALRYILMNLLPEENLYVLLGEDKSEVIKLNATLDFYIKMNESDKNK